MHEQELNIDVSLVQLYNAVFEFTDICSTVMPVGSCEFKLTRVISKLRRFRASYFAITEVSCNYGCAVKQEANTRYRLTTSRTLRPLKTCSCTSRIDNYILKSCSCL